MNTEVNEKLVVQGWYLVLFVLMFAWTSTVLGHDEKKDSSSKKQVSSLYRSIHGDPLFRVDPNPIKRTRAVLKRKENGLRLKLDTHGLSEGAYTVWMRVFNQPELCTGGENVKGSMCSRGYDLLSGDPVVPDASGMSTSSVFWIAALIVGEDGVAHVSTSVEVNEWPGMVLLGVDARDTDHQAVWNTMGAEVHIVLRYHGPAAAAQGPFFLFDPDTGLPSEISEEEKSAYFDLGRQLNRVLGKCSPFPPFEEDPAICTDDQLAVFPAKHD